MYIFICVFYFRPNNEQMLLLFSKDYIPAELIK